MALLEVPVKNQIRCTVCHQFATFVETQPIPGGLRRRHRAGLKCNAPKPEQIQAARIRQIDTDMDSAYAERRRELASRVPVRTEQIRAGRMTSLASAFIGAGLAR